MGADKKISPFRKFSRVLIANRGEIALRIIRSCRELGLETVAVYSDADAESLHRYQADFAIRLPGNLSADTYLNIPLLMAAVKKSGADAVHPGYGFLSENSHFAKIVFDAGIVFIGPTPESMEMMGNKIQARNLMMAAGVPVVPGAKEPLKDASHLQKLADEIGFPMILKAAGGGGGRGMRVVRSNAELTPAYDACKREAIAYFGNPDIFCERYIEFPRHIEFQVMFDSHGNGVHLFERDCSIQRRHQKLIEEAPSTFLDHKTRMDIGQRAIAAARTTGYVGAGTIEFICESPEKVFFMEMNTRIQVEHPVTEMITGIDLIATQIKVAMGEKLAFKQEDIRINGWSFEARINTEDAMRNFAPAPGTVTQLRMPAGPFVRVDSHLYQGYTIPEFYDSMVAKVITWGRDRDEAMKRLARALSEMRIEGVPTTAAFHEAVLADKHFQAGTFTTKFLEENESRLKESMGTLNSAVPEFFAAAGAALNQDLVPVPAEPEERREWQMTGRRQGMN